MTFRTIATSIRSSATLADFDALIARRHALGLRIIIDQVYAHTSDQHPWFQSSRNDPHGPYGDWYVWKNPKPDGSPPSKLAERVRRPGLDLGRAAGGNIISTIS